MRRAGRASRPTIWRAADRASILAAVTITRTRLPGAPEPMHEWPGGDGLTIRGDAWGDPGGRLVVLLHGGGQTRHAWRGAGETLACGTGAAATAALAHWRGLTDDRVTVMLPGGPLIVEVQGDDVWIEAWIDEDDLAMVEVGSPARVTLKPYPGREFAGYVETIGVSTDFEVPETEVPLPRNERMRHTPVVNVRIRLLNPEADLLPGLSAVVGIRKNRRGLIRSLLNEPRPPDAAPTATR